MKENKRIKGLFRDLYDGHPWLEVTILSTLENVPAARAAVKVHPGLNSIWEIVNHLVSWRNNVLRRVQGEVIKTPPDNYFSPVADKSEQAWADTLDRLRASQDAWLDFLEKADDSLLEGQYPVNSMSYYNHIHGIIHHDAYHLGQIVLLVKISSSMQSA